MKSMVVFFALAAVACGSYVPLAQPPYHSAVVLDARGRPLDTAEVINARALHLQAKALEGHYAPLGYAGVAPLAHGSLVAPVAHSVIAPSLIAAPAAVSHQSRVDVRTSPAIVSHAVAAPVLAHSALASPLLGHGLAGHGHWLKKRSLGHLSYGAPLVAHVAPSAVSHQSRVDVISSPAVVSHAIATPVIAHAAPVVTPIVAHAAPIATVYAGGSAVTHESRFDVHSSPAVISHAAYSNLGLSNGHWLHKRSLAPVWSIATPVVHAVPAAVSHQSRLDVISKPAIVSHSVVAPVLAHAPVVPLAHSAIWSAPAAHWAQSGLLNAAHW